MTPVPWALSKFMGIHTQPAKLEEGGDLFAADMLNLRIDGNGWLRLRSDITAIGPPGYVITGVATTPKHVFILRNTSFPADLQVQYSPLQARDFSFTRIYEADVDFAGRGVDRSEFYSADDFSDGSGRILIGRSTNSSEIADLDAETRIFVRQNDLTLQFEVTSMGFRDSQTVLYNVDHISGELQESGMPDFEDGEEVEITISNWHDIEQDDDEYIRFGEGDPNVWGDGLALATIKATAGLSVRDRDALETERSISAAAGIETLLEGRIAVVDFNTFVLLTSEGEDQGLWIDMREDNDNYLQAYTLGFNAPTDDDWGDLDTTDVNFNPSIPAHLTIKYFYKITYSRQFTVEPGVEKIDLFNGVESEASPAMSVANLSGALRDIRVVTLPIDSILYPADGQVTHINVYRTDYLGGDDIEDADSEKYQYRKVVSVPIDATMLADRGIEYQIDSETSIEYQWEDGELLRSDNQRLPSEAKSFFKYNDLVFAPVGDRLIYSDVRSGVLAQWAFPAVNEVRVEGQVNFCTEINEVLLFGSRDGLWRLTGTDEYNFNIGTLGNSGPIDAHAWSRTTNAVAFVGEGGLYLCDSAQVLRSSEIVLDEFFKNHKVTRGAVAFFQDNDVLYSVTLEDRDGTGKDYQFKLEDRYWVRWNLDFIQSTHIVSDKETVVLVADGSNYTKLLDWNDDTNDDDELEWFWESQILDGNDVRISNLKKRFREFLFNGDANNEMLLRIWVDENDAIDVADDIESRIDDLLDVRTSINRRGRKLKFRLSGTGPAKIQGLRLQVLV